MALNYTTQEPEFASVSKEAIDFIANLIVDDQDKRLSAEEALDHPWLQSSRQTPDSHRLQILQSSNKLQSWKKCTNVLIACSKFKEALQ